MTVIRDIEVEAICIVDIFAEALNCSGQIGTIFKDNPKGLYLKNNLMPLLYEDREYYQHCSLTDVTVKIENIYDLDSITADVYDRSGTKILKKSFIQMYRKFLSNSSPASVYAGLAVIEYIKFLIGTYTVHNLLDPESFNCSSYITEEKKQELYNTITIEDYPFPSMLNISFSKIENAIYRFIGEDHWFIYNVIEKDNMIVIEKTIDYRIHEWNKLLEEGVVALDNFRRVLC